MLPWYLKAWPSFLPVFVRCGFYLVGWHSSALPLLGCATAPSLSPSTSPLQSPSPSPSTSASKCMCCGVTRESLLLFKGRGMSMNVVYAWEVIALPLNSLLPSPSLSFSCYWPVLPCCWVFAPLCYGLQCGAVKASAVIVAGGYEGAGKPACLPFARFDLAARAWSSFSLTLSVAGILPSFLCQQPHPHPHLSLPLVCPACPMQLPFIVVFIVPCACWPHCPIPWFDAPCPCTASTSISATPSPSTSESGPSSSSPSASQSPLESASASPSACMPGC